MRPTGEEDLTLTAEAARELPEAELRERFWSIVEDLRGSFGDKSLPANFPSNRTMTRDEILAALRQHAYWFDPHGGHPGARLSLAPVGAEGYARRF
jgi:hypothetical protein